MEKELVKLFQLDLNAWTRKWKAYCQYAWYEYPVPGLNNLDVMEQVKIPGIDFLFQLEIPQKKKFVFYVLSMKLERSCYDVKAKHRCSESKLWHNNYQQAWLRMVVVSRRDQSFYFNHSFWEFAI